MEVPTKPGGGQMLAAYTEAAKAHAGIMDFRGKLLTLLPIASGTGIALLMEKTGSPRIDAIGMFGFFVTVALFTYELFNIRWCDILWKCAQKLEKELLGKDVTKLGPFTVSNQLDWPLDPRGAALLIYPVTLGAWTYFITEDRRVIALDLPLPAWVLVVIVMVASFLLGLWFTRYRGEEGQSEGAPPSSVGPDVQPSSR